MIFLVFVLFFLLAFGLALLLSYELRTAIQNFFLSLIPRGKQKVKNARHLVHEFNHAADSEHIQSHWHLQQWWILIAGFLLFSSIIAFAFTRQITPTRTEAEYLRAADPQIYAMLDGQILTPPPEVSDELIEEAIINEDKTFNAPVVSAGNFNPEVNDLHIQTPYSNLVSADRKWNKMNPRYKQRLLMVFKIMKEQHGYELVLLEGYRSPQRQDSLATNQNITRAKGFQSYHQFGLAADVAFKRDGKVVISERDPWAMRGYQLYGQVAESVGLTWGGRWKSIQDYGHTEYRLPGLKKTAEMAEKLTSEGQLQAQEITR